MCIEYTISCHVTLHMAKMLQTLTVMMCDVTGPPKHFETAYKNDHKSLYFLI